MLSDRLPLVGRKTANFVQQRFIRLLATDDGSLRQLAQRQHISALMLNEWSRSPLFRATLGVMLRYSPRRRRREAEIFFLALRTRAITTVCGRGEIDDEERNGDEE